MKKLGARDFEDIMQVGQYDFVCSDFIANKFLPQKCAIPAFDGLLPEPHNSAIIRLIFLCAHWHGLAKLRLHTDITLGIMDRLTTELGKVFLDFEKTVCGSYVTHELPREVTARQRRQQAKAAASQEGTSCTNSEQSKGKSAESKPLVKALNLQRYKHHSLGDYVETIRRYGTTDSYSTQLVRVSCYLLSD